MKKCKCNRAFIVICLTMVAGLFTLFMIEVVLAFSLRDKKDYVEIEHRTAITGKCPDIIKYTFKLADGTFIETDGLFEIFGGFYKYRSQIGDTLVYKVITYKTDGTYSWDGYVETKDGFSCYREVEFVDIVKGKRFQIKEKCK